MKIDRLETFLTNAGLRNYLFVRLTTDTGLTGIGEASQEWQEKTVETLIHEWVLDRVIGKDPFDIESLIGGMIRDQYQGGSTIMTAISGVEIALWDLVGKACGQPCYRLLGGRCHERLRAYANGWYGNAESPEEYAKRARDVIARGYTALKFDPFATAWKELNREEMEQVVARVAAVRAAVGPRVDLMIEGHGRLSVGSAIDVGRQLEKYLPFWFEEPVTPHSLELLKEVKAALPFRIAAGERLFTAQDFFRMISLRAADVVQMDPAHCGGLLMAKKIASMAEVQDMSISPHCSIGPVALCAALHVDLSSPNALIQEDFSAYDVSWRSDYVFGWNPVVEGSFVLDEKPGLGIELNTAACADHPYRKNSFPSLWDKRWLEQFTATPEQGGAGPLPNPEKGLK